LSAIPFRRGGGCPRECLAGSPPVAMINRATADQLGPSQDPVGKRLTSGGPGQPASTIVGVIDNLRSASLDVTPQPEIYRPASQQPDLREMGVALRASHGRP